MDICKDAGRKPFDVLIHSNPIWQFIVSARELFVVNFLFFAILLSTFFAFWFFAHSVIQCTSVLICAVEVIMQSVIK